MNRKATNQHKASEHNRDEDEVNMESKRQDEIQQNGFIFRNAYNKKIV